MLYVVIAGIFILGYMAIAFEHNIHVNKAASALLTAIALWVLLSFGIDTLVANHSVTASLANHQDSLHFVGEQLREHLAEIAEILFFLMGAMAIVELIDAHDGFRVITDKIHTKNASKLLAIITIITFFLSSLLDNLTTTMLWIGGQITATGIMANVFIPSIVCTLIPLGLVMMQLKGQTVNAPVLPSGQESDSELASMPIEQRIESLRATIKSNAQDSISQKTRMTVLLLGLGALAFVPIFKTLTHLPPYVGVLFGLAVLWMVTEIMHRHQDDYIRERIGVEGVLSRIDIPSILFFLGILLAVAALATAGILGDVAKWLDATFGNVYIINVMIGLLSSIVDNVPLVAGAMSMYPLTTDASIAQATASEAARLELFRQDGMFWEFLAYCAGTGGSCLIIGSAAGVAAMGMEKIPFMWYMKKITWLALIGYLVGAGVYVLIETMIR